jgi:hypothetical protein
MSLSLQLTTSVLLLCLSDHLNPPSLVLGILGQLSWPRNKFFLLPFLTIAKLPSPFLPLVHCALGPSRSPHLRLGSLVLWFCCHSSNRRLLRSSSSLTTMPLALALLLLSFAVYAPKGSEICLASSFVTTLVSFQ